MPVSTPPPDPAAVSRRTFILFLCMAPASVLCIVAIILVSQYKEFRAIVAPEPNVPPLLWTAPQQMRLQRVAERLGDFASEVPAQKSDSLWLDDSDLDVLVASSPISKSSGLRYRVEAGDSNLAVSTTQPVRDLQGKVAWIFRRIAKDQGYFNARVEGILDLSPQEVKLAPQVGFMNGQRFPISLLEKRGGFSVSDYAPPGNPVYARLLQVLTQVKVVRGRVLLVRGR